MKRFLFIALASLIISSSIPAVASANSLTSIVNTARSYLGSPYKYAGTSPSGFDCSGYIHVVFKNVGISIPRDTRSQYATRTAISKSNLKTGDLVFFNTNGIGVSHVGMYLGNNQFIHSATSNGVSISNINDPSYWGSKYIGAKRVNDFSPTVKQIEKAVTAVAATSLPTRSDIAEILMNELGLVGHTDESLFTDVPMDHPQLEAINAVANAGIFSGSNGAFDPNGNLTRAQLAKVLVEAFHLEGTANVSFQDVAEGNWSSDYIKTLYALHITKGYDNGNFGVNDKVTDTQFQTFIKRINDL